MAKKTYTIIIKINGKTVEAMPGVSLTMGGKTRKPLTVNGVAGQHYTEEPVPSLTKFKVAHGMGVVIDDFRNATDVTLVAECDSGITYQCAGAYTTNALELSDGDGGLSIEMAGPPYEEI